MSEAMSYTFEIPEKLPGLNDYTRANRVSPQVGGKMKRDTEEMIIWYLMAQDAPKFKTPVNVHFHWIEKDARRDLDNIAFAKKFILDALVKHGTLQNDDRKHVIGFTDTFEKGNKTKVIVTIKENE